MQNKTCPSLLFLVLCITSSLYFSFQVSGHGFKSPRCDEDEVPCDYPCLGASNIEMELDCYCDPMTIHQKFLYTNTNSTFSTVSRTIVLESLDSENYGSACPFTRLDANQLINGIKNILRFYEHNLNHMSHESDYAAGLTMLNGHINEILPNEKLSPQLTKLLQDWFLISGEYATIIFETMIKHENISSIARDVVWRPDASLTSCNTSYCRVCSASPTPVSSCRVYITNAVILLWGLHH